jgi:radical SAM protein with 4Fe4S-binding SPASM domain
MTDSSYLRLAEGVHPKRLEQPCLYDARTDDLYELNDEGYAFLVRCDGTRTALELAPEPEFLETCLQNELLERRKAPTSRRLAPDRPAPDPSLRYLEIQLTGRCNLSCAHCCLGPPSNDELSLDRALDALGQFEALQGLRVLLTGGEALLHSRFLDLNDRLGDYALRFVLLTNGTLLTAKTAQRLRVQEVQVSLDGSERGHDLLRGEGSYRKARAGLLAAREAGVAVSVATMVHRGNLGQFEEMARDFETLDVREWGIDVPCVAGRWVGRDDLAVTPEEAAPRMAHAFGGSYHGKGSDTGCGLHLATVTPRGEILRCGFYPESPLGALEEGLDVAWSRRRPWDLSGTRCAGCDAFCDCGGGCRYRAGSPDAPDLVMCAAHGIR